MLLLSLCNLLSWRINKFHSCYRTNHGQLVIFKIMLIHIISNASVDKTEHNWTIFVSFDNTLQIVLFHTSVICLYCERNEKTRSDVKLISLTLLSKVKVNGLMFMVDRTMRNFNLESTLKSGVVIA